jgi:hypothetical protein
VVFDLHFRIIENDGYPDTFFIVKHCVKCTAPDFISPPFFALTSLKKSAMFYMFYINNKKKESIVLMEELVRFSYDNLVYGWHTKFNNKKKIWHSTMVVADTSKRLDNIFYKTSEANSCNKFNNLEEIVDKLSVYHTFS